MIQSMMVILRRNVALIALAFAGFVGAAYIGSLTVDAGSTTPAIWLVAMWVMLGFGVLVILGVLLEILSEFSGN